MNSLEVGAKCPITGQDIEDVFKDRTELGYTITVNDERYEFTICENCHSKIFSSDSSSEFNAYFRKNKGVLIGHLLHTHFKDIQYKRIHFKSDNQEGLENSKNADLFLITEEAITKGNYPIHRKEKADNILRSFYQMQSLLKENMI